MNHRALSDGVTVIERAGLPRQRVAEDDAIPRPVDAHHFAASHFSFLRRRLPLVRVHVADDGAVSMTALGAPLVRLAAPVATADATDDQETGEMEVAYRNLGTWLYRDAGDIAFITAFDANAISLTVTLRHVRPRYWTWLYRQTHLRVHNALTRWFVRSFVREVERQVKDATR